jgi:hypothetical protein
VNSNSCHIRQWAKDGRTKEGRKVLVYAAECAPHQLKIETTSKASRTKQIDEHKEKHSR